MFARVTYVQAPEGAVERGLNLWRENLLPATMARDGFAGVISMVDRETGKALSITLWDLAEDLFGSTEAEYHREAVAKYGEFFSGAHDRRTTPSTSRRARCSPPRKSSRASRARRR